MADKNETENVRLVSAAGVKQLIKNEFGDDFRVAGDLADGLHDKVEELLKDAAARAKANGRATIRPDDL